MELNLIGLLLDCNFKSLDFYSEIVPLCFDLMVNLLLLYNTFFKLRNESTIMFHCSLVFFKLELFGIDLYVHSLNLLVSFVDSELSIFELFFPLLIIFSMLFNLLVELIFSLLEEYFSFFKIFL